MNIHAQLIWPEDGERYTKPMIEFYDADRANVDGFGRLGEPLAALSATAFLALRADAPFSIGQRPGATLRPDQIAELQAQIPRERIANFRLPKPPDSVPRRLDDESNFDPEDEGPRAYSEITCYTQDDGTIAGRHWTNDNLDRGYPNESAEFEVQYRNFDSFMNLAGVCRTGISGAEVLVTLNGRRVERGMTLADFNERIEKVRVRELTFNATL